MDVDGKVFPMNTTSNISYFVQRLFEDEVSLSKLKN